MRVITPQITWHDKLPVLCIDFDPSCRQPVLHQAPSDIKDEDMDASMSLSNGDKPGSVTSTGDGDGDGAVLKDPVLESAEDKGKVEQLSEIETLDPLEENQNPVSSEVLNAPSVELSEPVALNEAVVTYTSDTGFYRLATGGGDSHLVIWHIRNPDSLKPELICVSDLTRHTKPINIVRFSPDGSLLAAADDDAYIYIWRHVIESENETEGSENWIPEKCLRKHLDDIQDLSWSNDGCFLISASVDNSAIIWDIKKGAPLTMLTEHGGLVQGVSYDPLGETVATMCSDRILRFFNPKTGKMAIRCLKYPEQWVKNRENIPIPVRESLDEPIQDAQTQKLPPVQMARLFADDTLKTYSRRLSFSPKGEFLLVPGGLCPPKSKDGSDSVKPSALSSPSQNKQKSRKSTSDKDKVDFGEHAVIVFCRNSYTTPCAVIPTGTSYAIAVRFCPVYFKRAREGISYDAEYVNPTKRSERTICCVGKLKPKRSRGKVLINMPYKMVFAVALNDSVLIGDTEFEEPIAIIRNITCTRLTDISWSSDGKTLAVSSTDGFCSIITFLDNELGIPTYEIPSPSPQSFVVAPDKVEGAKETKTKSSKKKKQNKKDSKEKDLDGKVIEVKTTTDPLKVPEDVSSLALVKEEKDLTTEPDEVQEAGKCPDLGNTKDQEFKSPSPPVQKGINRTPKSVKPVTPSRNTLLDKWIIKKTPNRDADNGSNGKISDEPGSTTTQFLKDTPDLHRASPAKLSEDAISKLQKAPIIIDLVSDIEEKIIDSSQIRKEAQEELMKKVTIDSGKVEIDENAVDSSDFMKPGEKRPATSPLSSKPTKIPRRRIQPITLSTTPTTRSEGSCKFNLNDLPSVKVSNGKVEAVTSTSPNFGVSLPVSTFTESESKENTIMDAELDQEPVEK